MKVNKLLLASTLATSLFLVACGETKAPEKVADNQATKVVTNVDKKDNTAALTDNKTEKKAEVTLNEQWKGLEGRWVDVNDKRSEIEFKEGNRVDYYDGKEVSKAPYSLAKRCADNDIGESETAFVISEGLCLNISSLTDKNLDLTFIGRGGTNSFVRKDKTSTGTDQKGQTVVTTEKDSINLDEWKQLEGRWMDANDNKNEVVFKGGKMIGYYEGKELSSVSYTLSQTCPGSDAGESDTAYIVSEGECFNISSLTEENLSLTFVGRGNTTFYIRRAN